MRDHRETSWYWPPRFISMRLGAGLNSERLWQNMKWQSTDRATLSSQNGAGETYWICGTNSASGRCAVGDEAGRVKSAMMSQRQRAERPALDCAVWRSPRCWNTAERMRKNWKQRAAHWLAADWSPQGWRSVLIATLRAGHVKTTFLVWFGKHHVSVSAVKTRLTCTAYKTAI